MRKWLYKWLPIIFGCHCREDRSFHYKGEKFPICARCTGESIGIIFGIISGFFFRTSVMVSILVFLPMIIDGFLQKCTRYESNNTKRVITGFFFGYGLWMLFLNTSIMAFEFGTKLVH